MKTLKWMALSLILLVSCASLALACGGNKAENKAGKCCGQAKAAGCCVGAQKSDSSCGMAGKKAGQCDGSGRMNADDTESNETEEETTPES